MRPGIGLLDRIGKAECAIFAIQFELIMRQADASPHRSWAGNGNNSPFSRQVGDAGGAGSSASVGPAQTEITTIIATTTIFQIQTQTQTQKQTQTQTETQMVRLKKSEWENRVLSEIIGHDHRDCCCIIRDSNPVL